MTIQEALHKAIVDLRTTESSSATLDAEVLLSHVLRISKEKLLASQGLTITPLQRKKYFALVAKRKADWPIAYLTNQKEFYGLNFFITQDVLIPRPETETLIDAVLTSADRVQPVTIVDVGTGSGCIAISLARYLPKALITATDISAQALAVAKKNARQHKLLKRIKFVPGNLLSPAIKTSFDIIVANLPYLTPDQIKNVPHEPTQALLGGKLGLEVVDKLLEQASAHLNRSGKIFLEIDPRQTEALTYIVDQTLPKMKTRFEKDLQGRYRVAVIE
ncbi:peptide chain release factor N(5)-glutamine methyltransferase [Patescibacteria group bacterium]